MKLSMRFWSALAAGCVLAPSRTQAQTLPAGAVEPSTQPAPDYAAPRGPVVGLKLGYGMGAGVVYSGVTLIDTMSGALPIQLVAGWRFLPQLYAGLYGVPRASRAPRRTGGSASRRKTTFFPTFDTTRTSDSVSATRSSTPPRPGRRRRWSARGSRT